ncbi:MAG: hypothetical protein GXP62_16150, partial [Oligoflexia bacterium]|nr:hypothetical protein [Oligoflexia bacterium]
MIRILLALAIALQIIACGQGSPERLAVKPLVTPALDQPTVVFVVFDTVRADHLSLCGYA